VGATATVSQRLAAWAAELSAGTIPEEVRDDARWRLVDTVGVALAGTRMDHAPAVREVALERGGRQQATVLGFGDRLPATEAAFVNGALAHGPDFDDTHSRAMVHIGCLAVPPALAAGERAGATGRDVMTALVAGAEIGLRIAAAAPQAFHERGYHATGVVGPFVGAAVAGRLGGLDAGRLANALGLAGSQAAGLLQGLRDGSWVKRLHPGFAAQAGITCADLAARGFLGPPQVLEGWAGLYAVLLHGHPVDAERAVAKLGEHWLLPETVYKPYPNGAWNHSSMDAVRLVLERENLDWRAVSRVVCTVPEHCIPIVCEPRDVKLHPSTPYHMKFSLPYSVAILAVLGHCDVDDYTEATFDNAAIADFATRVECVADPAMSTQGFPARVAVDTRDGRRFTQDMPAQRGGPGHPMRPEDHRAKFLANARPTLGAAGADRLLQLLESAWEAPAVAPIVAAAVARTS
jgi:2-methylcitrate dehydratase PrpD